MNTNEHFEVHDEELIENIDRESGQIVFVPRNISEGSCIYHNSIHMVTKVFRSHNLKYAIPGNESAKYLEQRSADIFLPTIFIGIKLYQENKEIVDTVIDLIKKFIETKVQRVNKEEKPNVEFSIVTETTKAKKVKRISYKGDAEGIEEFKKIVRDVVND